MWVRILLLLVGLLSPAGAMARHHGEDRGHWGGGEGWRGHSGWHGDIRHFDNGRWRGGHWWHGNYSGRLGWWWIVGPDWYWYPTQTGPYPDPYTPAGAAPGYWYWCDAYRQYYPYVGACPAPWRAVVPR
jgi:hypothetical protein